MVRAAVWVASLATAAGASGVTVCNQQPVSGGGVARSSQLWQDPGPNGNDLNSDAVCWADFTIAAPTSIERIEWWGTGAAELGFRIEFWPQDPGTIAYQPYGVFYYGGNDSIEPTARFDTTSYSTEPGPGGILHHVINLTTPVMLSANDPGNPRWFIAIIGLTRQVYATWNWSQGTGTGHTFQFNRGEGPRFRSLGDGRALVLSGSAVCPADFNASGAVTVQDIFDFLMAYFAGAPEADINRSGSISVQDVFDFLAAYFTGCP